MKKVLCAHKNRMIEVVPGLLLSECCSYGRLSDMLGVTEDARALVAKAGGLERMRDEIEFQEAKRRGEAKERSTERQKQFASGLKSR